MKKLKALFLIVFIIVGVSSAFADLPQISDPMFIGMGARPLGMGKAYVALAEDADTIFINPAGLANLNQPKLTTMFSNLMGEINYVVFGWAYPLSDCSAFGVGIVSTEIKEIDLRSAAGASAGSADWKNSIVFAGYGIGFDKLKLGVNAKYYSQGANGPVSLGNTNSSGFGFDVGLLYRPISFLSLGLTAQNIGGTRLKSANDKEFVIPQSLKIGTSLDFNVLKNQKVKLGFDVDLLSGLEPGIHVGAEYLPLNNLALRLGYERSMHGAVEISDPTAGVGLKFSGMEFNYAYRPYSVVPESATHFFSISYVGQEIKTAQKKANETLLTDSEIEIFSPEDKGVVYNQEVEIAGKALGVNEVRINDQAVNVDPIDGIFHTTIKLKELGKNSIKVTAAGKEKEIRVLLLANYKDINEDYWAKQSIENIGTLGLIKGYPDGTFKPEQALTRAEFATILVRAQGLEIEKNTSNITGKFKDLPKSHWAIGYIAQAYNLGLIQGYPNNTFRPNNKLSKAEALTVLARFDNLKVPETVAQNPYADVSFDNWAAKYIQAAKDAGILQHIKGEKLSPKKNITRAEVVEILSQTSLAKAQVNSKLTWNTNK